MLIYAKIINLETVDLTIYSKVVAYMYHLLSTFNIMPTEHIYGFRIILRLYSDCFPLCNGKSSYSLTYEHNFQVLFRLSCASEG